MQQSDKLILVGPRKRKIEATNYKKPGFCGHLHVAGTMSVANVGPLLFAFRYNFRANGLHFMILELKLRKVGNSVGLLLPRAALDHLGIGSSGSIFMTPMPETG